eukprot:400985-Prorocentrum_minimum.AAC.4
MVGSHGVGNTQLPGRMQSRALPALQARFANGGMGGGGRAGAAPSLGLFPAKSTANSCGRASELNGP